MCAVVAETKRISQIRSYDVIDSKSNKITIWQAALATFAATSCFDPVNIGSRVYMDGGREANNPVHLVEVEARKIWCPNTGDLKPRAKCLVSLGTGHLGVNSMREKSFGPLSKTLMVIMMETEYTAERFVSTWEGGYLKRYFRFNVEQGLEEVGLAEYKKPGIVVAATEAYINSPEQKFKLDVCVKNLCKNLSRLVEDFSSVAQFEVKFLQEGKELILKPYQSSTDLAQRHTIGKYPTFEIVVSLVVRLSFINLGNCSAQEPTANESLQSPGLEALAKHRSSSNIAIDGRKS